MYKQWCKNLKNFIYWNNAEHTGMRLKAAEELLALTDVEAYKRHRQINSPEYRKTIALINQLQKYQDRYPSIKKFIRELWGYGFDIIEGIEDKTDNTELTEEMVKLVDLLYGTHYM